MTTHPFRAAVEARDLPAMIDQLTPDVTFHSPILFNPFEGRDATGMVLAAVLRVLEDFRYTDDLTGEGTHALVFEARVGDRQVQGLDLLRLDADGLIEDFTVMVRPLSAAHAVRDAMARELAASGSA